MNRYAQMISELKTPEVMKRLTYLYGQRGGMLVAPERAVFAPAQAA